MSEYIIKGETLSAMADEVRTLAGKTESLSPYTMATDIGDANAEISGQAFIISQIQMALEGKMSGSGGVELPELDNPADASEVFSGAEYIDESGNKKTGTFTIDNELSQQDSLIAQIQFALEGKATSGGRGIKTITIEEVQ